jgi:hypothetical protein
MTNVDSDGHATVIGGLRVKTHQKKSGVEMLKILKPEFLK